MTCRYQKDRTGVVNSVLNVRVLDTLGGHFCLNVDFQIGDDRRAKMTGKFYISIDPSIQTLCSRHPRGHFWYLVDTHGTLKSERYTKYPIDHKF